MNNLLCFAVFLTLAMSSSVAQYDFFMMTFQWPPAFCRQKLSHCVKSPGNQFTVHGLWPQNITGRQPRKCSSNNAIVTNFDANKMLSQTTLMELRTSWPNLKGKDEDFWNMEWVNHGTCSYSTFNQTQYFDAANNIWQDLQLVDIFRAANILPSNDYVTRVRFEAAIHNHIGTKVRIEFTCPYFSSEIIEIKVCKNHAGTAYMDCPSSGDCGSTFKWKP